jgi:hypothetical protein
MPGGSGQLRAATARLDVAEGIDAVLAARDLHRLTERTLRDAVGRARAGGATWQDIGDALGASRQAAFQRFGRPLDAPADDDAADRAVAVLLDLVEGRLADVRRLFDERMSAALSLVRLAEVRERIDGLVGAYRGIGEPFAHRAGDLTVVRVPLRFEAGRLAGEVTFDGAGRIAGLYVKPPEAL